MKNAILSATAALTVLLSVLVFNAVPAPSYGSQAKPNEISGREYRTEIKKLILYKIRLGILSGEISAKRRVISDLRSKIKISSDKIGSIKNKIKKDDLLLKNLILKVFLLDEEYKSARLLHFKDSADYFVVNFQLKTLLRREEENLMRLTADKDRFLKLKSSLKKEKNNLLHALRGLNGSKSRLSSLIGKINAYVASVKAGTEKNSVNKDKKNRLLKHKVIKLIHNLKYKSGPDGIKFIILKR